MPPIGSTPAPAKPTHGQLWVDVRDYGAKADGSTDNSAAIQAAVDDVGARVQGTTYKGVVFFPSAPKPYIVNKSIWVDYDNVEIRGEGWGSRVQMSSSGYDKHSVFIFGVKRVDSAYVNGVKVPLQVDASNRPDAYGVLDASAVQAPGTRWGLRTNGNTFVQFQACPLAAGPSSAESALFPDNWGETSKLTAEFCIASGSGSQIPPGASLFGMSDSQPTPIFIATWGQPNQFLVFFKTSDMNPIDGTMARWFCFTAPPATGPYRIAVQIDLDNTACSAFVNGVQVPIDLSSNLDANAPVPFVRTPKLTFGKNQYYPFMIGSKGPGGAPGPTGVDLLVYGLRLSNTTRYQNNGPGKPQTRTDAPATPVNDAWAYFGNDPNTICWLDGKDDPATSGRVVRVQGGMAAFQGWSSGLIRHSQDMAWISGNAIRDIAVSGSPPYGQVICVGAVLEMTIENVQATNGYHAVGSFNMAANYYVYLRNSNLDGVDSGYYGFKQLMFARDVSFNTSGRVAVRHAASSARWDNVMIGRATSVTDCLFEAVGGDYGGNFILTNWEIDFEGDTISQAGFYCETHGTPATSLEMSNIFFGSTGAAPLVQLRDKKLENPGWHRCWLTIDNMTAWSSNYLAAVDVDGPLWTGEMKGVGLTGTRFHHRQAFGPATSVVVYEYGFTAPPRQLYWYSGAHVLDVRSPAEGQFSEWRCAGTGTYGTPNPPAWAGLKPVAASRNALAGYVLNHGYITAALS